MVVYVVHISDASGSIILDEMSLSPRHLSDRELTLRAIRLTFQRAATAQRELTGAPAAGIERPGSVEVGLAELDRADLDLADLDLAKLGEEARLPNPMVTDTNLDHYLQQATLHQGVPGGASGGGRWSRLLSSLAGFRHQTRYNAAILHAMHQLDHRTQCQQRTIARLEAELADTRRALAAIEAECGASS